MSTIGIHEQIDVPDGYTQPFVEYVKWLPTIHDQLVAVNVQLAELKAQLGNLVAGSLVDHTHTIPAVPTQVTGGAAVAADAVIG